MTSRSLRTLISASVLVAVCGFASPSWAGEATDVAETAAEAPSSSEAPATSEAPAGSETPVADGAGPDAHHAYRDAVADYLVDVVGDEWSGLVVADEALADWDARQESAVTEQIEELEADGWAVRVAVLPRLDAGLDYRIAGFNELSGLQMGLTRLAAEDPHARTAYVVSSGTGAYYSVYEEGRLGTELARVRTPQGPPYLSSVTAGPQVTYALRSLAQPEAELELTEVEAAPQSWKGTQLRPYDVRDNAGSLIMSSAFQAALAVGAIALLLALLLLLPRTSGPLSRLFGTKISRAHEAQQLAELRDEAGAAHKVLTSASRLTSSLETAIGRIPAPDETVSPLVWAGWVALMEEHRKRPRTRCFFRPDMTATAEQSIDLFGAQTVVPVSDLALDRIERGREPSFLSTSGIDRGKPYWTRAASPWAASGFGAFGNLSEAIAAMPADWSPAPGQSRVESALLQAGQSSAKTQTRTGASPWARTSLLAVAAVAALVAGTWAGQHDSAQLEKAHIAEPGTERSTVADPDGLVTDLVDGVMAAPRHEPVVSPWSRIMQSGQDLAAVSALAQETETAMDVEVRVVAEHGAPGHLVSGTEFSSLVEEELGPGEMALIVGQRDADLRTGTLRGQDSSHATQPYGSDYDNGADHAAALLEWAQTITWEDRDSSFRSSSFTPWAEREVVSAPGTAAWDSRAVIRSVLGAGGGALVVLLVGGIFSSRMVARTSTDTRTDTSAKKPGKKSRQKSRQKSGQTSAKKSKKQGRRR